MSSYKVLPGRSSGFKIEIVSDGVHQTMLGFDTEAEAVAWVETDQARNRDYPATSAEVEAFHASILGDD